MKAQVCEQAESQSGAFLSESQNEQVKKYRSNGVK
jgi:hypothetical protein